MKAVSASAMKRLGLLLTALCLTACHSLPLMVPDLIVPRSAPVLLEGSGGPLTAARSRSILEGLARSGQATNIFDRHLALEEAIVGSPLTAGNQVTLLQDGPATYRAMLAAIESARDHIHMETYILDDDDVGRHFAQALIERRKRGVHVRLIHDGVGTFATPAPFFDALRASGVEVLEFNPINPLLARRTWEMNQRDHRKLLIVDGHVAFLGGINISSVYSGGSFGRSPVRRRMARFLGATRTCSCEARLCLNFRSSSWQPGPRSKVRR